MNTHPLTRTQIRNHDLLKECRRLIVKTNHTELTARFLAKLLAETPAPRYYIEYDYGLRVISRLERGIKITWKSPYVERQWQSLLDDVTRVRQRTNLPVPDALALVLTDLPAPSFFISPSTIYRIITSKKSD